MAQLWHMSNQTSNHMILTENLSRIFQTDLIETTALQNVDLHVKKGEFVAVMGPSGCGKSTLLNILGLLDCPNSGHYFFDGTEVTGLNKKQRTMLPKGNIGFVFQGFNLIDDLNVFENVELPLVALGTERSKRRKMVDEILEYMQIGHRRDHFPRQLSGGQQQRVAVA
jgi:putative ABC transport system ATP-binding protein